jgi:anti-anti-sigma factor
MADVTVIGSWALVIMTGEYDLVNAEQIETIGGQLVGQGVTDVTLDLSGITFMGLAAVNALIAVHDLVSSVRGRMVIVGAAGPARLPFTATGLDHVLPVTPPAVKQPRTGPAPVDAGHLDLDEDAKRLADQLTEITRLLLTANTVTADLRNVARAAAHATRATAASVTVIANGDARTAAVSDTVAVEVDVAQYQLGTGPCLDAIHFGRRVRVDVLSGDERYAHLAPFALAAGVNAVLSAPIRNGDVTLGSLNIYSAEAFDADAPAVAELIAAQAAAAIAKSDLYTATRTLRLSALDTFKANRAVNVAEGILIGMHHVNIDQARRLLRSAADANREPLAETARRLASQLSADHL